MLRIGIALLLASCCSWAFAGAPAVNQAAIDEVAAGRQTVAHADWWGFDPVDSTRALQSAIRSGAKKVVVQDMKSPWIVEPIQLAGDQEIVFEKGAIVEAKRGAFHGKNDALFTAAGRSNLKLIGYGAVLRMHRADYDGKEYSKSEWRHVIQLRGCENVVVAGLTLAESGGDGIYLGTGRERATNKNVVIRDVVCDRNYRQGISVITVEDLLIENCVLRDTAGTAPAAGIDFEPNAPGERLVRCVMRNCQIENNQGYGIHIYARQFDATTVPMSIRFENCTTLGTNARSLSIVTANGPKGPVRGLIEAVNCRFEDTGKAGITIGSNACQGTRVRLVDCVLADAADEPKPGVPVMFSSRPDDVGDQGNVEFVNLRIRERVDRPWISVHNSAGLPFSGISGNVTVERGGKTVSHTIDQALIDRLSPPDPTVRIPRLALDAKSLIPPASAAGEPVKIARHRVRGGACYLVSAGEGQTVSFALRHDRVGKVDSPPMKVEIQLPGGKTLQKVSVPLGEEKNVSFAASESGLFQIICETKSHTAQMTTCTHPVSLAAVNGSFHFIATAADLYFVAPAGAKPFGVRFSGEGDGERVTAEIFDAAGKSVWHAENIAARESYRCDRAAKAAGEVWKIHLQRPTQGVFEDHYVELRGVPSIVAFRPEELPRPRAE